MSNSGRQRSYKLSNGDEQQMPQRQTMDIVNERLQEQQSPMINVSGYYLTILANGNLQCSTIATTVTNDTQRRLVLVDIEEQQ